MRVNRTLFGTGWTACAVVIALVLSAFAHSGPRVPEPAGLIAFVAAGGFIDDLCGGDMSGDAMGAKCEACRLIGAALIPTCASSPVVLIDTARVQAVIARNIHHARPSDPARHPRAPPQA